MIKNKAFINISLLGLSLILSWSLVDYFIGNHYFYQVTKASSASCEYVKWPGAITNSIPVSYDVSGPIIVTSSPIYVKGDNVGIGTPNPQYKLHVIGTTSVSALCLNNVCYSDWPTGGGGTNYWQLSGNNLYPSSTNYNVAIGTTSTLPSTKLTVLGSASISQIGTNHIFVESPLGDERGIYFSTTDTNLRIYRDKDLPGWTVFRNDHSRSKGIGFEVYPDQVDFSIVKPRIGLEAQSFEDEFFTSLNEVKIGIGTSSPKAKLDVVGNIRAVGAISFNSIGNIISDKPFNYPYGMVIRTDKDWGPWARQFAFVGPNGERLGALIARGSNPSTLDFIAIGQGIATSGGGATDNFLTIKKGSDNRWKVGIGTNNPKADLHIERPNQPDSFQLGDSEAFRVRVENYWSPNEDAVIIEKTDDDPTVEGGIIFGFSTSTKFDTSIDSSGWAKGFYSVMTIRGTGNVGIGIENPQYKLHVIGTTSVSALCLGGVCRNSWPTGWGDGTGTNYWKISGNNLYVSSTNWNVGIGTITPQGKFEVDTGQGNMKFRIGSGSIGLFDSSSQDRLPYIQWIGENNKRAMYLGWGSVSGKYVDMTMENGYDLRWNGKDEKGNYETLMVLKNYGYLGINTLSPQYTLDVNGTIRSLTEIRTPKLCLGSDCRTAWPAGDGSGTGTGTNYWKLIGNTLVSSSTNWNIAIGTAENVTEPLYVKPNSEGKGIYLVYPDKVNLRIYQDMSTNLKGWALIRNNYGAGLALMVKKDDPSLVVKKIFSQGLGPLAATSTGDDDATIDSRVGIGTFEPAEKLHVMGNVFVQPAAGWSSGNEARVVLGDGYNYLRVKHGGGLDIGSYHGKLTLLKTQSNPSRTILEIDEE